MHERVVWVVAAQQRSHAHLSGICISDLLLRLLRGLFAEILYVLLLLFLNSSSAELEVTRILVRLYPRTAELLICCLHFPPRRIVALVLLLDFLRQVLVPRILGSQLLWVAIIIL